MYMMEVDRVLRPGGYWVLSGPPINWINNYQAWQRPKEELEEEQRKIEETAERLCWEKKHERGEIAIWQKRTNCHGKDLEPAMCKSTNPDDVWYIFDLQLYLSLSCYLGVQSLFNGYFTLKLGEGVIDLNSTC